LVERLWGNKKGFAFPLLLLIAPRVSQSEPQIYSAIYFIDTLYIGSFSAIVLLKRGVEKKCYPEIVMAAQA
jgi:hypothetical protein